MWRISRIANVYNNRVLREIGTAKNVYLQSEKKTDEIYRTYSEKSELGHSTIHRTRWRQEKEGKTVTEPLYDIIPTHYMIKYAARTGVLRSRWFYHHRSYRLCLSLHVCLQTNNPKLSVYFHSNFYTYLTSKSRKKFIR